MSDFSLFGEEYDDEWDDSDDTACGVWDGFAAVSTVGCGCH